MLERWLPVSGSPGLASAMEDDARNVVDGLGVLLQENLVALESSGRLKFCYADKQVAHAHGLVLVVTAHGGA